MKLENFGKIKGALQMKIRWEWCDMCDTAFIRCPRCGNNSCNGGIGKINDKECEICPSIWSLEDYLRATGRAPKSKEEVNIINKGVINDRGYN